MSESAKERSEIVDGGGDEEDGGEPSRRDDQKKKKMEHGCEGHVRKGKRVSLIRFGKVKQQFQRRSKRPSNSFSSSSTTGCSGKKVGCYMCFKKPQSLDSPDGSQTSDPNNPEFTLELLKGLIEKNDFYSKECNIHLDTDT